MLSRPKYLWHDYVKKSIMYSLGCDMPQAQGKQQEAKFDKAVRKVLAQTKCQYRGSERLAMIDLVYKQRRYNIPGAAVHLHISEGTARDWNREFVYAVAEEMGYL